MSTAIEDLYLYTSSVRSDQQKQSRKRLHSESSDDDSTRHKSMSPSIIDDDRRAHHNELERRRRDHIKDHFGILKDSIPLLDGEKSSRALILKRAVDYINVMQSRLSENQRSIDELRRKNELLEEKLRERETSVSPPARNASLGATTMQMAQLNLPTQVSQITPVTQIQQIPQNTNPIDLSNLNPAQLNSFIAGTQEAIYALTQSLMEKIQSPALSDAVSISPPAGLYPTTLSPVDQQQLAVRF